MKKNIACCGLDCRACDAFIATRSDDNELRRTTAQLWARQLDVPVEPASINCDGCQQTCGHHLDYCAICAIRTCCLDKNFTTCAECAEYVCERLQNGFHFLSAVLEMGPIEELEAKKISTHCVKKPGHHRTANSAIRAALLLLTLEAGIVYIFR